MSSPQTKTTELAIAFGLLDCEPHFVTHVDLNRLFRGSLSPEIFDEFSQEFYRNQRLYRRFYSIGVELRICYPPFEVLDFVRWTGEDKQSQSVTIPQDIVAANTPISIKATSNIVYNRSAHKLFIGLPTGSHSPARTPNWFVTTVPEAYQNLYAFTRNLVGATSLPEDVQLYHKRGKVKRVDRMLFADQIDALPEQAAAEFEAQYTGFCWEAATHASDLFNQALSRSGHLGKAIECSVFQTFFRVGDTPYIVCGSDEGKDFAVEVPNMTSLIKTWRLKKIEAYPDLAAGQSKVRFRVIVAKGKIEEEVSFWCELRWSHHKFLGSPEAKLYKGFGWTEVPFFNQLYTPGRVHKLGSIGSGGFGAVYAATLDTKRKTVAVKELRIAHLRRDGALEESRERFKREVTYQSQLKHSNIMPILDSDLSASSPWFATELATHSLVRILNELPSDQARIKHIYSQILQGLAHAHAHGLVHRDIKPSNIFIFAKDLTKIGDFGLVKTNQGGNEEAFSTRTSCNSLGSRPYAAPELLESFKNSNHLSDIYSLGVTLYAMVLGTEPATTSRIERVNSPYREFIKKCIEQHPADRFQSVSEAIQAFTSLSTLTDEQLMLGL